MSSSSSSPPSRKSTRGRGAESSASKRRRQAEFMRCAVSALGLIAIDEQRAAAAAAAAAAAPPPAVAEAAAAAPAAPAADAPAVAEAAAPVAPAAAEAVAAEAAALPPPAYPAEAAAAAPGAGLPDCVVRAIARADSPESKAGTATRAAVSIFDMSRRDPSLLDFINDDFILNTHADLQPATPDDYARELCRQLVFLQETSADSLSMMNRIISNGMFGAASFKRISELLNRLCPRDGTEQAKRALQMINCVLNADVYPKFNNACLVYMALLLVNLRPESAQEVESIRYALHMMGYSIHQA